jgi:formamidopyrimidine-DNA glycosylase
MPELPEVETVARGLRRALPGRVISDVRFGKADFVENPEAFAELLPGARFLAVERAGKFLHLALEPTDSAGERLFLLVHLGMTGQLTVRPAAQEIAPHTHVFFTLDDGRELRYTDPRRFGRMQVTTALELAQILSPLGAEPLDVNENQFAQVLRGRRARVKALLLDQHVLRGMGNIYCDESLWRARIHPARLGATLKRPEIARLHRSIRKILEEAILLGGSSLSDFVNAEGVCGEFQIRHRVYQREGRKCTRCRAKIRRIIVAGRSSYYCPHCQRAPRSPSKPGRTR